MFNRLCLSLALGMVLLSIPALSQDDLGFEIWPDPDACETFIVSAPISTPIYRADMPWDVALGYMVLDTICKTYTPQEVRDRIKLISDDSLLIASHIYYRMWAYDPLLFSHQAEYQYIDIPASYLSAWQAVGPIFLAEYYHRFYGVGYGYSWQDAVPQPRKSIAGSEGLYRIRVLGVTEHTDSVTTYNIGPCTSTEYCVDAEVLTVYNGQRYYSNCNPEDYELQEGTGCIRLYYTTYAGTCNRADLQQTGLEEGREYLVFANLLGGDGKVQGALKHRWWSHKRFEIADGNLLDPKEFFGADASVPFEQIDTLIRNTLDELQGR